MNASQTYIIAGGSGLIGRALAQHWLGHGQRVIVLTRRRNPALPHGVEALRWDGVRDGPWRSCLNGARAIVNLCGENIGGQRWSAHRKQQLLDSRITPTAALLTAMHGGVTPAAYVQASGIGYYGNSETQTFTEQGACGTDFLANLSRRWEAAAAPAQDTARLVVARLGVVLARDAGAFPKLVAPFRFGVGGPIASGRQWLSWIHIDDAVRALAYLADNDNLAGPINCSAPTPLRNRDAARVLGKILRRPSIMPAPRFALELTLGEMATLVCDGQRVLPERLAAAGFEFRYATFDAAAAQLLDS